MLLQLRHDLHVHASLTDALADCGRGRGTRVGDHGAPRFGKYGVERTERACEIALRFGGRSYKVVANILKHGRDKHEQAALPDAVLIEHDQVRGPEYYQ